MFVTASRGPDHWLLSNRWGHELRLPCRETYAGQDVSIGVLGTGTREKVAGKTALMAGMLAAVGRPLYLLDVRRNGTGGQGSWSPREFASVIPDLWAGRGPRYEFVHLPCLAPPVSLLERDRQGLVGPWQEFRRQYVQYVGGLGDAAVDVGRAFVEAAAAAGGMAVLLCAEPDRPGFDDLAAPDQNASYCHRFTLARQIARRLKEWPAPPAAVRLVQLDLVDFRAQRTAGGHYRPRTTEM